jgi:Tfp pilus assembly protein PilP
VILINLLAWRAELRAARRRRFCLVLCAVLIALIGFWQSVSKRQIAHEVHDAPISSHAKETLEKFSLSELKRVGYLSTPHQSWAIIHAPDGNYYRVTVGDHLGKNNGKVLAITDKNLVISEWILDGKKKLHRMVNF